MMLTIMEKEKELDVVEICSILTKAVKDEVDLTAGDFISPKSVAVDNCRTKIWLARLGFKVKEV